ncbi:MAG: ATP-binding protein [Desulfobacterales bacterium]|nr:ATP-binding protein [Desulfobacterales bacterium]
MNNLFTSLPRNVRQAIDTFNSRRNGLLKELHPERLLDMLADWLLDEEQKLFLGLAPWNIYFLNAAATGFELQTAIGSDKGQPSTGNLKGAIKALDCRNRGQERIIRLICSRLASTATDLKTDTPSVMYEGAPVHIGLLSGALQLAALLDLKHPDTIRTAAACLHGGRQIPTPHFCDGFTVEATGPHPFIPGAIRLIIHCRHPEIHRALKHHEKHVQKVLHLLNNRISPRFLFSEVHFDIEASGYTPLDMKFSVDSMAALQLFTGNRLYSDKRVFLRELIQNAVDACTLKKLFDPTHQPDICIEFDGPNQVIRFRDNGIGMDRQWIEKYFLKIGISFYRSGDLKTAAASRVDFNFISKFGIGFLSGFLVSDKIVIKTRKKDSQGMIITITGLENYFDVRFADHDCAFGTQVTLYLADTKNHYSRFMEYVCYLKTNIRFLSLPVTLIDHEKKRSVLGKETLPYDTSDFHECAFSARLNFSDAEGYLFLKTKRDRDTYYGLETAKGGISLFQDGIFVTQTDSLLPEGARQSIIGRINLKGRDRCELSMDRNRLFWTDDQMKTIKRRIRLGIADLARQVMDAARIRNTSLPIQPGLIRHLSILFDFNEIDDEIYQRLSDPIRRIIAKRFRDFIRVNAAHTGSQKTVPGADGYSEDWQKDILTAFENKARPRVP